MEFRSDYSKVSHLLELSDEIDKLYFEVDGDDDMNDLDMNDMVGGSVAGQIDKIEKLSDYEKDFFEIFNKAREYRQRLQNLNLNSNPNQMGGGTSNGGDWTDAVKAPAIYNDYRSYEIDISDESDDDMDDMYGGASKKDMPTNDKVAPTAPTKKRASRPQFMKFIQLVKAMRQSGKYPNFKSKHIMKIAKLVMDEAKAKTGSSDPEVYAKKATELAMNDSARFIKMYNDSIPMESSAPASRIRAFW